MFSDFDHLSLITQASMNLKQMSSGNNTYLRTYEKVHHQTHFGRLFFKRHTYAYTFHETENQLLKTSRILVKTSIYSFQWFFFSNQINKLHHLKLNDKPAASTYFGEGVNSKKKDKRGNRTRISYTRLCYVKVLLTGQINVKWFLKYKLRCKLKSNRYFDMYKDQTRHPFIYRI